MGRVEGKVAIVTGGGSGIGEAIADLLAAEGASVLVDDIRGSEAERVAGAISDEGGRAISIDADVSDEEQVEAMVAMAVREFGRLDILDNNAALTEPAQFAKDRAVADMELDTWERVMAVNLRGVMLGCKHAIPVMRELGGGIDRQHVVGLVAVRRLPALGVRGFEGRAPRAHSIRRHAVRT